MLHDIRTQDCGGNKVLVRRLVETREQISQSASVATSEMAKPCNIASESLITDKD